MNSFKTRDGLTLKYRTFGEGARTAILVHGWMTSGAVFDPLIESLTVRGLRLLVPDQRGTGDSSASSNGYTLDQYADDVLALADHAQLGRFALVGHSMGGQIAQKVATLAPDRISGLALLCTVPASGMALPPEADALFRTSGGDTSKQRTILQLACKQLPDDARDRLLADAAKIPSECIVGAYESWTKGGFAEQLSKITAPTLVLSTDDPFLPPDFLQAQVVALIRGAQRVHLPGPGHYPQVERPVETSAVVGAFLAGLGG